MGGGDKNVFLDFPSKNNRNRAYNLFANSVRGLQRVQSEGIALDHGAR